MTQPTRTELEAHIADLEERLVTIERNVSMLPTHEVQGVSFISYEMVRGWLIDATIDIYGKRAAAALQKKGRV